ncbi:hypothetical protein HDC32_005476 [Pseudomonas sp. JAI120]|nr:hypothetical protein [Pseudomonas sp. SJZ073]MBB6315756.1 hypothetical protein [Pseudomonas sp. JAI120]
MLCPPVFTGDNQVLSDTSFFYCNQWRLKVQTLTLAKP